MNAVTKIAAVESEATERPFLTPLAKLREPFPEHQISKLPKESKAQADERKADRNKAINCPICKGWHHKNAVHLDYVGHAALTDRLLDADPAWSWEPAAMTAEGLPAFDRNGGLWIKLTVGGVTRLGYGSADGKTGGDAVKEIIGDALRNAAMRFGAALDLWHKGDLHLDDGDPGAGTASAIDLAINLLRGCGNAALFKEAWAKNAEGWNKVMTDEEWARVNAVKRELVAKFVAEAEAAKATEQAPAHTDPFNDEIPL